MKLRLAAAFLALTLPAQAAQLPIRILAAENFYGGVAQAIGGDRVSVESILIAPGTDPHDFEPPPSVARKIADADIVVMNGAGYDHWVEHLLEASSNPARAVIDVAALIGVREGDNPHIWYDPKAIPALSSALVEKLAAVDPEGAPQYASRARDYAASLDLLNRKIAEIKDRFAGAPVTASEPVFGPMAAALGLDMKHEDFQTAIMNESEPSPSSIAALIDDLRSGKVKALFYNSQVSDPLTEQLLAAAKDGSVPVVPVTETKPEGKSYADWMLGMLDATTKALAAPAS